MKRIFPVISLAFLAFVAFPLLSQTNTDSLLYTFNNLLPEYQSYIDLRQERIDYLKIQASNSGIGPEKRYMLYQQIYQEYRPYICDSAMVYLYKKLEVAEEANNDAWTNESRLTLSNLFASIGLYKESIDILASIHPENLSPEMRTLYFDCMDHAYGELFYYSKDPYLSKKYRLISETYKDSLKSRLPHNSERYLELQETYYRDLKDFDNALKINDIRLHNKQEGSPGYALVCFHRSLSYKDSGNFKEEKLWLLRSAITDIRLGITDNASSWRLAMLMYEEGDITAAYNYINYSMDNSNIFNARLRHMQIAAIQSIINRSYQMYKQEQENKLRSYLIIISILSLLFLGAVIGIYFQNKKLSVAHQNLQHVNSQLNELNFELSRINKKLKSTNLELLESNHIKEEYIGHFLTLCSSYIDKLDEYRRNVNRRLSAGNVSEVLNMAKSPDFFEKEIEAFYTNFDTTFLRLYPDFVNEFNNLLIDEERIILKKDELLNTELRIFALIRLGIDNSSKIAELLRYSSNTIYNYRAKIKNKAKGSRDDFELLVKKIGTFTK